MLISSAEILPDLGRYAFFYKNYRGETLLADRHDNFKVVQDLTHEYAGHCGIIEKQWNDDFELYTDEVLEYIFEGEYWSYEYLV
jgi:hypothetical protein